MAANHLHGHVQIKIKQARNLPDMESWFSKLSSRKNVTDAYVDVRLGSARLARTKYVADSLNPSWNETYRREVCHFTDMLRFEVNDKDTIGSDHIGVASIPTASLIGEKSVKGWLDIEGEDGSKNGQLKVSVKYTSRESIEKTYRVPCYFPMRENCSVTLYQDAEVPPGTTQLDDFSGNQVESPRCWRDVYDMIIGAKHLICITGWAVWTQLVLKRSADLPEDERNLGDILIKKADEGVSVHVMIWNDNTSGDMIGKDGFMGTHDMETFYVFNGTNVHCALAPRVMECNEITDLLYTHHQKSIICDAEDLSGSGKRRLVAFVGGLDLTNGRYDTPAHPLFCTLLNEHKDDFHNANAPTVPASQGPREPWHDIHSKVEGPIAYDIFRNFHERWQQQGTSYGSLDSIDQSKIDVHSPAPSSLMDPHNSWNVQLFRSISSDSAKFSKKESKCLNTKHSQLVESSIQQAYVQMIRNAENFIYIENQYFFGSAFCWLSDNSTKCKHIIPNEIAHKIVTKIRTGERFCAYILIPMFPEGDPASSASQEILYWQTKTMEMMYHKIGKTIAEEGSDTHPTDWLLFLCLAKREPRGDYLNELEPDTEPMAMKLRQTLRSPIYVHSKMMIVDDAYIIVGSANINQRSMAGTRDTEMAVGCWQPAFPEQNPFGSVHAFRMSLWKEHLCAHDPTFSYPQSLECIRKMKDMVSYNWHCYTARDLMPTPGHCLPYPLNILQDGTVENIPGYEEFPDFPPGSKIMGRRTLLPQKLTT